MNAITEILAHPFVYKFGWTLVHLLWQGVIVALLLAILLRLLRKSSANVRYLFACLALATMVVLPIITFRLVPSPPSYAPLEVESASFQPMTADAAKIVPLNLELTAEDPSVGLKQRAVNLLEPALPYIVAAWVLGVFSLSLWHLGGWTHLQRLRRRLTKQADASLLAKLRALAGELKVARPVRLLESAIVQIPTVVGWFRPVILLPATALTGLSAEQLEALLAHELAHIRRGDYLINMLQTVVEIFGFYHPAVWWISNKIRIERENCCDDIAVAVCSDKMHYATALAEMERIRSSQVELAVAANGGNLLMRIRRLIAKSPTPKQRFNWAAALITALVIATLAIPTTIALSRNRALADTSDTSGEFTRETDKALPPIPVSAAEEAEEKAQILFELKYYDLPSNSKLIKEAAKDGIFVRTDKAFAERLLELSKESKSAKVLSAPRVLVIEGEEAVLSISNDIAYISGYSEQPGGETKPINKTVRSGIDVKVMGHTVGDDAVRVRLMFTQITPTLTTHKITRGREIQIPIVSTSECVTDVTVCNNGLVIIGALRGADRSDQSLVVQIVTHIVRKSDEDLPPGSLPIADSSGEVDFSVEPQAISSVRVDTEGIATHPGFREGPSQVVERLIRVIAGQALPSFEMLDLKTAVPMQLDDLRKLVGEQPVQIDSVISGDKQALVTTRSLKDDRGREGHLVFRLAYKDGKWAIDDIDFEDPKGLENEIQRFNRLIQQAGQTPMLVGMKGVGVALEEASGEGVFDAVNRLVQLSKGKVFDGVDAKTREQADELAKILGDQKFEVANSRGIGRYALVVSKPIEADGEEGQLVFNLSKRGDEWVIDDIDFESPGGVKDEMKRFNDRPLKAGFGAPGMGAFAEAPMSLEPITTEPAEKVVTRIYILQHAKAADVAADLEDVVSGTGYKIVGDEASNRIVAVANEEQHKQIEALILQLDAAPVERDAGSHVRAFELKHANALMLSSLLKSLLTAEQSDVKIVPGPGSSQLTIRGNQSGLEQITKLIEVLDRAPEGTPAAETVTRIFPLKYADSQEIASILNGLSVLGRNSRIVSNTRLNQVIIEAPEADLIRIKELISEIDIPADEKTASRQSVARDKQLAKLIQERESLAGKMQALRAEISKMEQDFGIGDFGKVEDLMLQRAANTMNELAKTESQRFQLESQLGLLEQSKGALVSGQEQLKMRQEYVSADATVKALAERIAQVETELLLAKQTKASDHPEVKSKTDLLKALKDRLNEAKEEVGQVFDKQMASQAEKTRLQNIDRLKTEIEHSKIYEQKIRAGLDRDNQKGVEMARSKSQVQALRDELEAIRAMYDEVNRRITDIRMQPKPEPTLYDISEPDKE